MVSEDTEFLTAIEAVTPDYKSLDTRVVAIRSGDYWVNLSTRVLLSTSGVPRTRTVRASAGVDDIFSRRLHLPANKLGTLLRVFDEGVLKFDGLPVQYSRVTSGGAGSAYRPYFRPRSRDQSGRELGIDARTFTISGGEPSIESSIGVRQFELLESRLAALTKPYRSLGDFIQSTTGIQDFTGWHSPSTIEFIAPVNIVLAQGCELFESRMLVRAIADSGHKPDDVSVGVIQVQGSKSLRREQRPMKAVRGGRVWRLEVEVPVMKRTEKVVVLLSYRGDLVDDCELYRNRLGGENPRMTAFSAFDSDFGEFGRGLEGKSRQKGGGFEESFLALLSFLGFTCIHLKGEDQPDALVWGPNPGVVYVVECTTAEPDLRNKSTKFASRIRRLAGIATGVRVVGLIATSLPREAVNPADIQRLQHDRILLVDRGTVQRILQLAKEGAGTLDCLNLLEEMAVHQLHRFM